MILPFRPGPEKFPPVTVTKDRFPAGVWPNEIGAPILRVAVKRYLVAGSAGAARTSGPAMAVVARATNEKRDEANIVKQPSSRSLQDRRHKGRRETCSWYDSAQYSQVRCLGGA